MLTEQALGEFYEKHARDVWTYAYRVTSNAADADDIRMDFTAIAERHNLRRIKASDKGRGNVAFCDGHAEFYDRVQALNPLHWDPRR